MRGFCPAIIGILPAPLIVRLLYDGDSFVKTKRRFELHATLASIAWGGLILFPLFWLGRLGLIFAFGYVVCHVVYSLVFVLTICPACATRRTCPGGKFSALLAGERG